MNIIFKTLIIVMAMLIMGDITRYFFPSVFNSSSYTHLIILYIVIYNSCKLDEITKK